MNTTKYTSPQILSGRVSLGPGASQTIALDAMASRSHRWLRLDELALSLWVEPQAAVGGNNADLGGFVQIRARAYRQDLMLDYVPAWLMGPRMHRVAEYAPSPAGVLDGSGNSYGSFCTYRWKFPKPFYLPPGAAFVTQLRRNKYYSASDLTALINAELVVRAAQMSETEARAAMEKGQRGSGNPIPFMAAYTPLFPSGSYTNKSGNLDLANPFLTPLYLQRMTGRTINGEVAAGGYSIRLADTRTIITEWTEFTNIFPTTSKAWTHTRVLQPSEYVTAELKNPSGGGTAQVAIVGYRNEVLP